MKKIKALLAGLLFTFGLATGTAQAAVLTGSISAEAGGGLTATSPWDDGLFKAALGWNVFQNTDNNWVYNYTFFAPEKEPSHVIFEVSKTFTEDNILEGTTAGWELGLFGDEGKSNPGIPGDIYGLKFDTSNFFSLFTIVSDRAPMWGDFYAKDGKYKGNDVFLYNDGFGLESSASVYDKEAPYGFALVPNTVTSQVPEPGSLALLSLGLLGAGFTLKRQKKMVLRT